MKPGMIAAVSRRASDIKPFMVMEVLEAAQRLEREGVDVVHMEVGEPGFPTPSPIVEAAARAMNTGHTHYTHSQGIVELREAICGWHWRHYGTTVDPAQVVVTLGTSPAVLLVFMAICEPGDEIIISNPHYACYPQLISFAGGVPVPVCMQPESGFQANGQSLSQAITRRTRAILINSPSNPTGTLISADEMEDLTDLGILVVSDEIYHGLVYGDVAHSIREFTDHSVVINGFSKLYAMTGWRLGYLIAPPGIVRAVQKLQQNLFISACHFGQIAAITALSEECDPFIRAMAKEYDRRRRLILNRLPGLGLRVASEPRGAFYVFADAREHCRARGVTSYELTFDILKHAGVAVTPGSDFGSAGEGFLRFSYATDFSRLEEGLARLGRYFA
jgi:(5-formylfuran-3-yl)methyl phosphate transaminase